MFNPLEHRGIPLDQQVRNWRELDVTPIDPMEADPYTRCRINALNGIEIEAIMFSHHLARHWPDQEVRRQLAEVRYIEAQQQRVVNWLLPGMPSALETTIAYEQVAVDLTAWVSRMEPDPYLRQAYEFGVLEDFDHLYRYANLFELIEHRKARKVVDELTEVMPGRPGRCAHHHRRPGRRVDVAGGLTMHLAHYLGLLHRAQVTLGDAFRQVGATHRDEVDVFHTCGKLAAQCDGHAGRLEPFAKRYAEQAPDEPERLHSELFRAPVPVVWGWCGTCRTCT